MSDVTPRKASHTALMVAGYRARATAAPDALCSDPWAAELVGEEGLEFSRLHDRAFPHGEMWLAVRTAWLDARVRSLAGPERPQVVILGAGFDTRAARLAADGVRFFEVDQPATQADKLARLERLDGYPMDAATFVSCDFERDDFLDRLVAAGFDAEAPALVLWEGVTHYLTEEAIRATLTRLAVCDPGTVLLFDYINRKLAQGNNRLTATDERLREMVADLGEPFVSGFNDPLPILQQSGFRHIRTVSFDQACLSLTGTYDRERLFRFQHFAIASRGVSFDP